MIDLSEIDGDPMECARDEVERSTLQWGWKLSPSPHEWSRNRGSSVAGQKANIGPLLAS